MARITSMVVKLDNGKYRTIKIGKVKSIYTDQKYICAGTIEPGEDDAAGPETDEPQFTDGSSKESFGNGGSESDGGGDGPVCFWVDGMYICM